MERPDLDSIATPDLAPTDDGLEDFWGSGHVSGPFDADELAELERDDA